jgi:tRNA A-37 threonylcarbamoyl transferase component Bud32
MEMIVPKPDARLSDLGKIERSLREAAATGDVEIEDALRRLMQTVFAAELRAERRVVEAAVRQPRAPSVVPAAAMSLGASPATTSPETLSAIDAALDEAARVVSGVVPIESAEQPRPPPSITPVLASAREPTTAPNSPQGMGWEDTNVAIDGDPTGDVLEMFTETIADNPGETPVDRPVSTAGANGDGARATLPPDMTGDTEDLPRPRTPFAKLLKDATAEVDERTTEPKQTQATETTTIDFSSKRRIARYQTQSIMRRSATTIVFRGRDPNVSRPVVLKVMDPDFISDPRLRREEWISVFKREARLSGRVLHTHLPTLYDAGRDGNVFFMVYSLFEGELLSTLLERGDRIPAEHVRRIVIDLASALEHLHDRGIVHCDLRAANVIVGANAHGYLIDLSMACELTGPEHPLLAANVLALAPECLSGASQMKVILK